MIGKRRGMGAGTDPAAMAVGFGAAPGTVNRCSRGRPTRLSFDSAPLRPPLSGSGAPSRTPLDSDSLYCWTPGPGAKPLVAAGIGREQMRESPDLHQELSRLWSGSRRIRVVSEASALQVIRSGNVLAITRGRRMSCNELRGQSGRIHRFVSPRYATRAFHDAGSRCRWLAEKTTMLLASIR